MKPAFPAVALKNIAQIPVRGVDTGIPMSRLIGFVLRNGLADPIGGFIDGQLFIYNDWRLRALQEREGVPVFPEPESLTFVVIH